MGYSKTDLVNGRKATGASFVAVGVTVEGVQGVYLTQIVPAGADKITDDDNTVSIQTINPQGGRDRVYTYHKGDRLDYKRDGWYNSGDELIGEDVDDVFFPKGTGLWMQGTSELTFTTSGEVLLDSQQFDLVNGRRFIANPYPSKINLTSLIPVGADKITDDDNTVSIQTINAQGGRDKVYTYHKGDRLDYKRDGWYNSGDELIGEDVPDVQFDPGVALWTQGTSALDMQIVTPFEDAE